MKFNLAKFKKVHEDEHSATLEHPNGHSIKIAKKHISPDLVGQLKSLPMCGGGMAHYDEGGQASQEQPKKSFKEQLAEGMNRGAGENYKKQQEIIKSKSGYSDGKMVAPISDKIDPEKARQIAGHFREPAAQPSQSRSQRQSQQSAFESNTPEYKPEYDDQGRIKVWHAPEAEGGMINAMNAKSNNPKLQESKKVPKYRDGGMAGYPTYYADGSESPISTPAQSEDINPQDTSPAPPPEVKVDVNGKPIPEEGPEPSHDPRVMTPTEAAYAYPEKLPYGVSPAMAIAAQQAAQQVPPPAPPLALQQNTQPSSNENPTPSATPNAGSIPINIPGITPEQPSKPDASMEMPEEQVNTQQPFKAPSLESGYEKQVEGIAGTGKALQDLGLAQQELKNNAVQNEQRAMKTFQDSAKDIMDERQHLTDDIRDTHIDPQRLYSNASTGAKIASAVGLILGGMGGALTGQGNPALNYLNKLTDQDIDAQKAELGKKENLLSANYRRFGELNQATAMTKLMMSDILKNQLDAAAAGAQNPIEKARAQQAIGQIDAAMAPAFQQLSILRSLQNGGDTGQDPASFVKFVVPEARQAEVFKEVERAQNTQRMRDAILKSFDAAATDVRPMSGGRLKNLIPGTESSYVGALHQAMGPTFSDLEGTVRQAAMDNTFGNITPKLGNSDEEIAVKRQALQDYLQSKLSAPVAKGFGIDLSKFKSTSQNPEVRLNPQQQEWVQWARNNPNNPKSALLLKKLGL